MGEKVSDDNSEWHLDKKVPITLILAILIQTGVLVRWGTNIESRLASLETTQVRDEKQNERRDNAAESVNNRMIRMEVITSNMLDILKRIESRLDITPPPPSPPPTNRNSSPSR